MLWVTATAVVWLGLVLASIAMCRAASLGDAWEDETSLDRASRLVPGTPAPLRRARRTRVR
jgi:hypothetical protein